MAEAARRSASSEAFLGSGNSSSVPAYSLAKPMATASLPSHHVPSDPSGPSRMASQPARVGVLDLPMYMSTMASRSLSRTTASARRALAFPHAQLHGLCNMMVAPVAMLTCGEAAAITDAMDAATPSTFTANFRSET